MRLIRWVEEHPDETILIIIIIGIIVQLAGLFPGFADPYGRYD
jgi:hypothetical protein